MKNFWPLLIGIFIMASCDYNPFFGEDTIPERSISGKVILNKSDSYDGTFVWLEGTESKAITDEEGKFTLKLPAISDPNDGGIVDGGYMLYFFMGNYELSQIEIQFSRGQVVPDIQTISSQGELYQTIYLSRLFELETIISPKSEVEEGGDNMQSVLLFDIFLRPDVSNVFIYSKRIVRRDTTIHTGLLVLNSKTNEMVKIINIDEAKIMRGGIMSPTDHWRMSYPLDGSTFTSGEYKILPFIVVDHEKLPNGILNAIGSNIDYFNETYKLYPMKRTGGKFVVQ